MHSKGSIRTYQIPTLNFISHWSWAKLTPGQKNNSFKSGCSEISLATMIQLVFQIISKIAKSRDASLNFKACWNEKEEREGDFKPSPRSWEALGLSSY